MRGIAPKPFVKIGLVSAIVALTTAPAQAQFQIGDVFAGIGSGQIKRFDQAGNLLQTLDNTTGSYEQTGMAFDVDGNLFSTNFTASSMSKFSNSGTLLQANFGSGFDEHPESIAIDSSGNLYVGQADGSRDILKFDPNGNLLASFDVPTTDRGSDWIDLAADECTMFYTSEGSTVKRFDVCTNSALGDFATGLPRPCFGLRILPAGGAIVACFSSIQRLDATGAIVQTYDVTGEDFWFAMNLDPDGTSFWSGNISTGQIYKFDIASGNQLATFPSNPNASMAGLAVFGEITAVRPGARGVPAPAMSAPLLATVGMLMAAAGIWLLRRRQVNRSFLS